MVKRQSLVAIAALASAIATPAWSDVLTFDGNICGPSTCGNGTQITQTYGDVAGVVDVIYNRQVSPPVSAGDELFNFWTTGYSDLVNVAWGGSNDNVGRAEIFLKPLDGNPITLNSLDLGTFGGFPQGTQLSVLSGASDILFQSAAFTVDGVVHSHFDFNLTSADGIRIQFGPSAFNVGIDNVNFTTGRQSVGVPEPTTVALFSMGLFACVRRRRIAQ